MSPESYTQLHGVALKTAMRFGPNFGIDAMDIAQDALVKVIENEEKLRSDARGWVAVVTRRLYLDELGKKRRTHLSLDVKTMDGDNVIETIGDAMPTHIDKLIAAEEARLIRDIVKCLDASKRRIIEAVHKHGKSLDDAAKHLKIKRGTARSRYGRALKILRREASCLNH